MARKILFLPEEIVKDSRELGSVPKAGGVFVKCVLPELLRCGPLSARWGDLTNFRDGFQQLGPESLQVFWCLLQTGEGIHSQLCSTALFIIRLFKKCLLSACCILGTDYTLWIHQ